MLRCVVQRCQTALVWSTCAPRKLVVPCLEISRAVSQGDPDNIEKTYYTWGMQLDTVEWEDEEGVCPIAFPRPVHVARFAMCEEAHRMAMRLSVYTDRTAVGLIGATHEKLEWKLAEFVTRGKVPLPI